jgi:Mlc titration factor MtfA (ptsG expression regulator)
VERFAGISGKAEGLPHLPDYFSRRRCNEIWETHLKSELEKISEENSFIPGPRILLNNYLAEMPANIAISVIGDARLAPTSVRNRPHCLRPGKLVTLR